MNLINLKRGSVYLLLVFLLLACQQQDTPQPYPFRYSDGIMGTTFTIKVSQLPDSITVQALKGQIKVLLNQLNDRMSTYQAHSELSIINQNTTTDWLAISTAMCTVLKEARKIGQLSAGAFDITVGPLVNLWGFGPDLATLDVPELTLIEQQRQKVGLDKWSLKETPSACQFKKTQPDVYLDLSAIAKGYAVDRVGLFLESLGIVNYMVEIGGELRLKGGNIQHKPWRIAVEKPVIAQRMIQKVLPLSNISLATSGDYRNFYEVEGKRFSHTIDPRTGYPITHHLASVTILANTTMTADALATMMMVLGEEQGLAMAEKQEIAALFITKTDEGFAEKASSAFINQLQ